MGLLRDDSFGRYLFFLPVAAIFPSLHFRPVYGFLLPRMRGYESIGCSAEGRVAAVTLFSPFGAILRSHVLRLYAFAPFGTAEAFPCSWLEISRLVSLYGDSPSGSQFSAKECFAMVLPHPSSLDRTLLSNLCFRRICRTAIAVQVLREGTQISIRRVQRKTGMIYGSLRSFGFLFNLDFDFIFRIIQQSCLHF